MEELKKQIIHPEIIKEVADELKIVATPSHGTGNKPVRRILAELGFKHVYKKKIPGTGTSRSYIYDAVPGT